MLDSDYELLGMLVLVAGTVLLSIAMATILALLGAWAAMIALGDLHAAFHAVPAIGYLTAFMSLWALSFVGMALLRSGLSTSTSSRGGDR